MAEGCAEKFDVDFYRYIWTFDSKVSPKIVEAISTYSCKDKLLVIDSLKRQRSVTSLLQSDNVSWASLKSCIE
jgi:L-lactate utilization protein LutC